MNIGVLGTGVVGEAIATALTEKGHSVKIGSRTANNEKGIAWAQKVSEYGSYGTYADAVQFGDLLFVCLNGAHTLSALEGIDKSLFRNKIIIDVTNPLDFSKGMPPTIIEGLGNTTSLGEKIQDMFPEAYVVKALNTINYKIMVDARAVNNGDHNLFICGNNDRAKMEVKQLLTDNFHWKKDYLVDLGGITSARAIEAIVPFWVLVYRSMGTPLFNFKIVH